MKMRVSGARSMFSRSPDLTIETHVRFALPTVGGVGASLLETFGLIDLFQNWHGSSCLGISPTSLASSFPVA
jgi:hypothetical protein